MSEKQLGAAPEEEDGPVAADQHGWFQRLRSQPGFRTAAVAFLLTVVLSIGGPAAFALWSKTFPATITGAAAKLPPVQQPICNDRGTTEVSWIEPAAMPEDAVYIVEVTKTGKKTGSLIYAFPKTKKSFEPGYQWVGNERFDSWMDAGLFSPTTANITVTVGALPAGSGTPPVKIAAPLDPKVPRSELSPATKILSKGVPGIPWYVCE